MNSSEPAFLPGMTEKYKSFPPRAEYLKIPVSSRAAALAGLGIYPACRPRAVWTVRALKVAVKLFGPRILPGSVASWTPPMESDLWAALVNRWRAELGKFDTTAVYKRAFRPGFALLLLSQGHPVAFLKVRNTEAGVMDEVRALKAIAQFQPRAFSAPVLRAVGSVQDWAYFATAPFPAESHRVPEDPPIDLVLDEIQAALSDLPRPPGSPDHWQPMHGDLTPWNLRQGKNGNLYLFDWEHAGWGPPGADEVLYRAVQIALGLGDSGRPDGQEAIQYWTERIRIQLDHPNIHPLAPALERTLRSWQPVGAAKAGGTA